jgi:hypothetical protein
MAFENGAAVFGFGGIVAKTGGTRLARTPAPPEFGAAADGLGQQETICGKSTKTISVIAKRPGVPF